MDEAESPSRPKRGFWAAIVATGAALACAALAVLGMLAMMGYFAEPTLARVVRVEQNGDLCIRDDRFGTVDCVSPLDGVRLNAGDCVLANYGEGIRIDRRTECPD